MSGVSFYLEDVKQEQALALLEAKKKYGEDISPQLESRIRANARKDFLAKMVYGGPISIPFLREDDSQEIKGLKKSAQNPLSVDDEEIFLELTGGNDPLEDAISSEMANLLKEYAPTVWGLYTGDIKISKVNSRKRKKIFLAELWNLLLELYPSMDWREAEERAEEIASITWRDRS